MLGVPGDSEDHLSEPRRFQLTNGGRLVIENGKEGRYNLRSVDLSIYDKSGKRTINIKAWERSDGKTGIGFASQMMSGPVQPDMVEGALSRVEFADEAAVEEVLALLNLPYYTQTQQGFEAGNKYEDETWLAELTQLQSYVGLFEDPQADVSRDAWRARFIEKAIADGEYSFEDLGITPDKLKDYLVRSGAEKA